MATIQLDPWLNASKKWFWFAMKAEMAGQTPTILLNMEKYQQVGAVGNRIICWSQALDTDDWHDFDNVAVDGSYYVVSNNTPFPAGDIYLCWNPAYPYSRTQRLMAAWLASDYVADTVSGSSGVLGTATERQGWDLRVIPALNYYGFKITDPDSEETKNKCVLISGMHAAETMGRFLLEGLINFLLSDDAVAVTLRTWFEFYVYPCISAQGIYGGYSKTQPESWDVDPNRQWNTPGALENVDAFKSAIVADTGGSVEAFFDFHGSAGGATAEYAMTLDKTSKEHPAFETAMKTLDVNWNMVETAIENSSRDWAESNLDGGSMVLVMTPESPNKLSYAAPGHYLEYGENYARALHTLLLAGDFPNGPA